MTGNHHNGTPVYKKIQSEIRNRIASARLKPGDAVASERELAKTHKVSLMTARHAWPAWSGRALWNAAAGRARSSPHPRSSSTI